MARHVADGKDGGEKHSRRHHYRRPRGDAVDEAHHHLGHGQTAPQQVVQFLDHLGEHGDHGESYRGHKEQLDPGPEHVAVQQAQAHQAARFRRRSLSRAHWASSSKSPPLVEPISRLTSRRPTMPTVDRIRIGLHIASHGDM